LKRRRFSSKRILRNVNEKDKRVVEMKVFQINSVCGIRSTGRICTDLAETLEKHGHESKIAYGRETVPQKYQKYAVRIGNNTSVKIDALKTRLFDNAGFNSKRATKKLIRQIEEYNPDVIHLHNLHGYYLNVECLFTYLKTCGKKIVWTLHDCWSFTGHCAHFDFVGCKKWHNACERCPQKKKYPKSALMDKSKRNYSRKKELFTGIPNMTIVTPSQWLADLVKQSFLKEYDVRVIRNGIDTNVFQPTESNLREQYNLQDKKILLGVASVWDERKGLNDFIALSHLLDKRYQIVLIGVSKSQIKLLPSNIIGIERTNDVTELAQWYTVADVFLNLTYEDNYPTVNLEAQACGIPVITYATGGSVESVTPSMVVKQGNLEGLQKLLLKDNHCEDLLFAGFSKEACYDKYIDLYEE